MIKEKITALIKKENKGNKNNKRKIENLIFAFVLLVITLISINIVFKDNKKSRTQNLIQTSSQGTEANSKDIQKELEEIIKQIKGVEDAKILITYSETERLVPIYNENSKQSTTEEKDTEGGTRVIQSYDSNKEVVSDSSQVPITEKIVFPKIEGAVVIAKGAQNTLVKENIIHAVEAATGLATHKIQVFEMK